MKIRIAKKWSKALRSGEYKQATGRLNDGERDGVKSMCCLGVLCDIHSKETGKRWGKNKQGSLTYFGAVLLLPRQVAKWAGLTSESPLIGEAHASIRNDKDRDSFRVIANAIDKHAKNIT